MKNKIKTISLSLVAASLLSGCASGTIQQSFDKNLKTVKDVGKGKDTKIDDVNIPNLSSIYKTHQKKLTLNLSNPLSLSKALEKLSKIDGRKYHLHKDTENLMLFPSNMEIKTFGELRLYIEDTMEKTIFISKNAILKNRLKVIKVQDIRQKKWDLKKVNFTLNTQMSVKDALERLSQNREFQFSISIDHDDFGTNDNKIFKETYINYKGNTVSSFFKYLEDKLNIFIDINYENKIVKIEKYQKQSFQLNISNLKMTVSGEADTQVTSDGEAQKNAITEQIKVDIYSQLEDTFNSLISNSKSNGNKNSFYTLDEQTGLVTVLADRKTLEQFIHKVEKTNDAYKDMIEVEIISFDLVFSKDYLYQTGFNTTTSSPSGETAPTSYSTRNLGRAVSSVLNTVLSYSKVDGDKTSSFLFNSLQNMGYVANKNIGKYALRNHIPDSDSTMETERYMKNITSVGETDSIAASTSTETDIIKKPEGYSMTAHYTNGMISLDIRDYRGQLLEMDTLEADGFSVSNPKTKSNEAVKHIYLKDGEAIVVKNKTNIATKKDFNGMIPTNWLAANALGGGYDEDALYTQSIRVIKAKKLNNL